MWNSSFGISSEKHKLKYICAFLSHFYNGGIVYVPFMNSERKQISCSLSTLVSVAHLSTATGLVVSNGQGTERITWIFSLFFQVSTRAFQKDNALNSFNLKLILRFSVIICDGHQLDVELYLREVEQTDGFRPQSIFARLSLKCEQDGKALSEVVWHQRSFCLLSTVVSIGTVGIFSFR